MPVQRVELIGRRLTDNAVSRKYYISGPADEDEVAFSIGQLPRKLFGFSYVETQAEEVSEIPGDWLVTVIWGRPLIAVEYRFNFTAPQAHITRSIETVSYSTTLGTDSDSTVVKAPNFGGGINVVQDGGKKRVEGFDLAPPSETFTLTWGTDDGFITPSYQRIVENIVGTVNSFEYRGRPPGSLLLNRVSGGRTGITTWAIEFGFSYVQPSASIPIGNGITVSPIPGGDPDLGLDNAKRGHDLLWVYYGPNEDTDYDDVVPRPEAAYVERVWPYSNFCNLQLPDDEHPDECNP